MSIVAPSSSLVDSNSIEPPSPTPPMSSPTLDSITQLPSNVNVDTPVVNETGTGCGDNRIFILPRGQEFTSQTKCARRIGKIIEKKFNGPWKSFKNVPIDVRDSWFNEFEKEFCWHDKNRYHIRKIFDTVSSNILKNRLFEAKKSNKKPAWISQNSWSLLQKEWGNEHYKKICEQNKKNRASDCGGLGFPKHTGGSITFLTHMDRLKEKHGHEPTLAEVFMHTHTHRNRGRK